MSRFESFCLHSKTIFRRKPLKVFCFAGSGIAPILQLYQSYTLVAPVGAPITKQNGKSPMAERFAAGQTCLPNQQYFSSNSDSDSKFQNSISSAGLGCSWVLPRFFQFLLGLFSRFFGRFLLDSSLGFCVGHLDLQQRCLARWQTMVYNAEMSLALSSLMTGNCFLKMFSFESKQRAF